MALQFVDPQDKPATLNAVLYGAPGSGKTTGSLSAPGPILYVNAEGTNAAMFARRFHVGTERAHQMLARFRQRRAEKLAKNA